METGSTSNLTLMEMWAKSLRERYPICMEIKMGKQNQSSSRWLEVQGPAEDPDILLAGVVRLMEYMEEIMESLQDHRMAARILDVSNASVQGLSFTTPTSTGR